MNGRRGYGDGGARETREKGGEGTGSEENDVTLNRLFRGVNRLFSEENDLTLNTDEGVLSLSLSLSLSLISLSHRT